MEGYLGVGTETGASPRDGYNQIINNMDHDMVLKVESDLKATNTIEVNLQVVENQAYRSHLLRLGEDVSSSSGTKGAARRTRISSKQ
jgi:hypothetical protein